MKIIEIIKTRPFNGYYHKIWAIIKPIRFINYCLCNYDSLDIPWQIWDGQRPEGLYFEKS